MRVLAQALDRRRPSNASLLAAVLLAAVVTACGGGDDDAGVLATLTATSGGVEIAVEIPEGALPSGVALSDISVVGLDRDEAFVDYEGLEPLGGYRLEPAGMEFEVPLRLTVELADGLNGVQALLVSSDRTVEVLEPIALAVSTRDDRVRVTYEIGHFSDFWMSKVVASDPLIVLLPPLPKPSYVVGESFTVRVRVHAGFASYSHGYRRDGRRYTEQLVTLLDEPWSAEVTWSTSELPFGDRRVNLVFFLRDDQGDPDSRLEPQIATTSVTSPATGSAAFAEQRFTCDRAGDWILSTSALVRVSALRTVTVDGGVPNSVIFQQGLGWSFTDRLSGTCVGGEPTVDPTPDPTETIATPEPTEEPTPTPPPVAATLAPGFDPCHINPNEEAIGCLPHYDVTSASSRVRITPDRRLMYEGTREFGGPIPTNPEYPIEYFLVLEGNGQRMEFLLEGGPGQPLTCTRTVNGAPSPLAPGEACGELIAPNQLRFAGDITAFAPGGLVRTFSTFEIGADGVERGDYLVSSGEEAWELAAPQ